MSRPPLVLASGSPYRARLLAEAGLVVTIDPPDVDERALDAMFHADGPEALATELARRKVLAVAERHPHSVIIGGDQVGVLASPGADPMMLTKRSTARAAVDQLMAMSGTSHQLVNGLAVARTDSDASQAGLVWTSGLDVHTVTMRRFSREEAERYVRTYRPFDTAGSYRLEDQDTMEPGCGLVSAVQGEDRSGVLGLPLPLLRRLLTELGVSP